jgi:PTS system fructose-specific IIC component
MALGVGMRAPHGGIFVIPLSNQPFVFLGCIVLGSLITAAIATLLKGDFEEEAGTGTGAAAGASD